MFKSFLLSCIIFTISYYTSAQDIPWMVHDLPHEIHGISVEPMQKRYTPEIINRSEVRAVLDTLKVFRQTGDLNQQINEVHYGFDSRFGIIYFEQLFGSSDGNLTPYIQIKSERHSSGQLLLDTAFRFSNNDGIWLNYYSRQNKFDPAGNNVVSAFEEWSEINGNWSVTNIIDRVFANGLLMNEASRRNNGQGGSALTLETYATWDYESPFGWTNNQYFINTFQGLSLLLIYTREFDENGNLRYFYVNDIDGPGTLHYLSEKYEFKYDNLNRLVQEIKSGSFPQWQLWQLGTRKNIDYHSNNRIERVTIEQWDSISNVWHLKNYTENQLDSYGNIILETHYTSSADSPGTYVLDKTVEYIYDLDYGPGSFVAIEEVDHSGYMLNKSITTVYRDSVHEITTREYIYKVLQTNSISSTQAEIVNVFPNPFNDYIHVEMDDLNFPELILEIYSLNGVLCLSKMVHHKEQVQVDNLIPGNYLLLLKTSNAEILKTKKIVKQW